MLLPVHPDNPEKRKISQISENLAKGGIYILPTDTVYALTADAFSAKAMDKILRLKKIDQPLALICKDISQASEYLIHLPEAAFKMMKRVTPGPFIFILKANKNLPKHSLINTKTREIGIRIPDSNFMRELLDVHPGPLLSTGVVIDHDYYEDPAEIDRIYGKDVTAVVDCGLAEVEVATIISFTSDEAEIIREGKGLELV